MPATWQGQPKNWRVRGKARDGMTVTLGRYDTEAEARTDLDKFAKDATYRNLSVEPIPPAPPRDPAAAPITRPTRGTR